MKISKDIYRKNATNSKKAYIVQSASNVYSG